MITRLRNHFADMAMHTRLIEREQLLFNPEKILPQHMLFALALFPPQADQSFMRGEMTGVANKTLSYSEQKFAHGISSMYVAELKNVPQSHVESLRVYSARNLTGFKESLDGIPVNGGLTLADEMMGPIANIHDTIMQGDTPVYCRAIGDWINDFEHILKDPQLAWHGKVSNILGQGRQVLNFWRELNSLPDWAGFVKEIPPQIPPGPRRKNKVMQSVVPLWQPAAHTI